MNGQATTARIEAARKRLAGQPAALNGRSACPTACGCDIVESAESAKQTAFLANAGMRAMNARGACSNSCARARQTKRGRPKVPAVAFVESGNFTKCAGSK
jgi:hypothetical protein